MLNAKTKESVKIILIILGMLAVALTCLFMLTKETNYVEAVDVNNQNDETNSSSVKFDAGIEVTETTLNHSGVIDVDDRGKYLRTDIGVAQNCVLYNPTVQVLTEAGSTKISIKLGNGFGNITNEHIKSSNASTNTVVFNDLNGAGLRFKFQLTPDFEKCAETNQTYLIRFTGDLVDASGNNVRVTKDIYVNIGWTASHSMELSQSVDIYRRNHGTETLTIETNIQNQIKTGTSGHTLPVKQTEIVVDVPTYAGISPSSVDVKAKKTSATNGRDETNVVFSSRNWNYNSSTGKVTITVNNPEATSQVEFGRGADSYTITYTYPKAAYDGFITAGTTLPNKVTGKMILYSNTSTSTVTKTINDVFNLKNEFGIDRTSVGKLGLYINALHGDPIKAINLSGIFYTHYENIENVAGRRIEFGELKLYSDTTTYNGFDSATNKNNNPIVQIYIDERNFKENLGESGYIKIYDDNCQHLIGQITTSTTKNSDGEYEFNIPPAYQLSSRSIILETSAPQKNLSKIEIGHLRQITGLPLTLKQVQDIVRTGAEIKTYTARKDTPTNFELDDNNLVSDEVELMDSYTDANLKVETGTLDASNPEFQELKLKIILDNMKEYSDAWSRPYFDITLPEYITEVYNQFQIGTSAATNIHYEDGVSEAIVNPIDGKLHFTFNMDGNQEEIYNTPTSITLTMKVKVNKYAPTSKQQIKLDYMNAGAKKYKNEGTWTYGTGGAAFPFITTGTKTGTATGEINIVNTPILLCVSELSGYNGSEKLNSIDNPGVSAQIARLKSITPTMTLKIQNNHTVPVSNVSVIGRIPYTNNKYAIENTDLGTNINTTLAGRITGGTGKNFTIYYSDNLNATKDVGLAANNWVADPTSLSTIKSYLIVFNDTIAVGEQVEFKYDFIVAAESNYNKTLFVNFGAYYEAEGTSKTAEASKIGLTTGARGNLTVSKTGEKVGGGTTVREGDIIKYTIKIENPSEYPVEGVKLVDSIPEHTSLIELKEDGTYTKNPDRTLRVNLGTIGAGKSTEYFIYVVVEEITENMNIQNTAQVEADGMDPEPSNTSTIPAVTTVKEARLEVTKTSDIPSGKVVKEGDFITYTITVRNTGGGAAKNVMVKDTIPEGTIYYDMDTNTLKPGIRQINSEVKETLEPNASFEFTFKVQVGRISAGKKIENTATVVGDNVEETPSNTEGVTAEITVPKLRLEKETSLTEGQIVKEGDQITYTITVYNDGTTSAYDVEIKDRVPEYTTYYENGQKNAEKIDVGKVIPELKAGTSESYSFTVIVEEIPENTVIQNTATVKGENGPEESSNTVGVTADISVPELKLEKRSSVQEGQTIETGDIITYTIVATNTGDCIAHNVVISDTVPENTIYVEKMGGKYVTDANKREIRKEVEQLAPGETATLSFSVMVGELDGNVQITNQARVDANNFEGGAGSNTVGISAKPKDSGKKGGELPNTGKYQLIIIAVVGVVAVTVFAVYEYKTIKRRR